jgi:DNA-binding response OmpR family regulator
MKKILLINGNHTFYKALKDQLESDGEFHLQCAESITHAALLISRENFNVSLLDLSFCDESEDAVIASLCNEEIDPPLLVFIEKETDLNSFYFHDFLIEDYILKPFKISTLIIKLRETIVKATKTPDKNLKLGRYTFIAEEKVLIDLKRNNKIRLTEKETAILRKLYLANGKIVTRKTLLEEVWGYNAEVASHTLETHMYKLRKKLEHDSSDGPELITALNGYQLVH